MEIVQRAIYMPDNKSFIVREVDLTNNRGVIHTHQKYELNFIVDARGKRFVAGNISNFSPGDLTFMAPGIPHSWEIDNKEIFPKAMTIHFNNDFFDNLSQFDELGFLQKLKKKSRQGLFVKGIQIEKINLLFDEIITNKPFDKLINVLKLLRYINDIEEYKLLSNAEYNLDVDNPKNKRIKTIYDYVFHNFQRNIKLSEIASLIGLSDGAFCAFFKKSTKKTFFAFLKEIRIGFACKLLIEDLDKPVSDICFESGYNNFTNFNRQFKEITGVSPKEYRERYH
jgi:AraC-like DNA-binding protein